MAFIKVSEVCTINLIIVHRKWMALNAKTDKAIFRTRKLCEKKKITNDN